MTETGQKTIRYPRGYSIRGHRQLAVRFPEELFQLILARAKKENKGFSEMVVELCKCGELDLSDCDAHEQYTKESGSDAHVV